MSVKVKSVSVLPIYVKILTFLLFTLGNSSGVATVAKQQRYMHCNYV